MEKKWKEVEGGERSGGYGKSGRERKEGEREGDVELGEGRG